MVRRRVVEGGALLRQGEDFAALEPVLIEVLGEGAPTDGLLRRLRIVPASSKVVSAVLEAVSAAVPKDWRERSSWNQTLDELIFRLPQPANLAPLVTTLSEPVRTNLWFALSRAGVTLSELPDDAQLEAIASSVLEERSDFCLEPRDEYASSCSAEALQSNSHWTRAVKAALDGLLGGTDSIDPTPSLNAAPSLIGHLELVEPLLATLAPETVLRIAARVSWGTDSDLLVNDLVARHSVEALETAFSETLADEPSVPLARAIGEHLSRAGRPWPEALVPRTSVEDFTTGPVWKLILPRLETSVRDRLLASQLPLDGAFFHQYATPGLYEALEAWARRAPNPWVAVKPMLRAPLSDDAARLVEHFLDTPTSDGLLSEVSTYLPFGRLLSRAKTNPELVGRVIARLSERGLSDDDFFDALEAFPLPADAQAKWLMQRPWSPRVRPLAERLPPSQHRTFLTGSELRRFLEAPEFAGLRKAVARPNEIVDPPATLDAMRASLWFRPALAKALPKTLTATDAVLARLEAGALTDQEQERLLDALLDRPAREAALVHLEPLLGLKRVAGRAREWLDGGVEQGLPSVIAWVETALGKPKLRELALQLASRHPKAFSKATNAANLEGPAAAVARAVNSASEAGVDSALLDEALEVWRRTRHGGLGLALAEVMDVRSEATFQALMAKSERGFQAAWIAAVQGGELRAAADAMQRPTTTQHLLDRIYRLSLVDEGHPAAGAAIVRLVESGALDGAKSRYLTQNLTDALARHGDRSTLKGIEAWDDLRMSAADKAALGKKLSKPASDEAEALMKRLAALPKRTSPRLSKERDLVEAWLDGEKTPWLEALFAPKPKAEALAVAADKLLEAGDRRGELLVAWSKGDGAQATKILTKWATTWAGPLSALARVHELGFSGPAVVTHFVPGRKMTKSQQWLDAIASPQLRAVTHLAFPRSSRHMLAMIEEASKHRLRLVCVPSASKAKAEAITKGTSVRVVTVFHPKAFFAETTVLPPR